MAVTLGDLYAPVIVAYHVAVVAMLLAAGRTSRPGVAVLILLSMGIFLNLRPMVPEWIFDIANQRIDTAVLLTVCYLLSQVPGPVGGRAFARPVTWIWAFLVVLFLVEGAVMVLWGREWFLVPTEVGFFFHESLFCLEAAILALHAVPGTVRLARGPLRTQSLFLILAVGLGMAEQAPRFAAIMWLAWDYISTHPWGPAWRAGRHIMYVGYAYFTFAATLRLIASKGRDATIVGWVFAVFFLIGVWAVAGIVGTGQTHAGSRVPHELGFEILRPIIITYAILRYDIVVTPLSMRRLLIPLSFMLAAFAVVLGVFAAASGPALDASSIPVVQVAGAFAVLVLAIYLARRPIGTFVDIATGGSGVHEATARLARYRLGLERAKMGDDRILARLRTKLGITDEEHAAATAQADMIVLPRAAVDGATPGAIIGGAYTVVGELGEGGQGRVLLADGRDGGRFVLKEVPLMGGDARALEREHAALRAVDHPGVARSHGIVREPWGTYMVRDHIEGATLEQHVREQGPLVGNDWVNLMGVTRAALEAMHVEGVAHLDIKPANVILGGQGTAPVLIDAGSAVLGHDRTTTAVASPRQALMTLRWAAPEQAEGRRTGPWTDWYQWAGTLYFAATGSPPATGSGVLEVQKRVLDAKSLAWPSWVPADAREFLESCRARDPKRRPER